MHACVRVQDRMDENKTSISPSVKLFVSALAERSFGTVASRTEKHNGSISFRADSAFLLSHSTINHERDQPSRDASLWSSRFWSAHHRRRAALSPAPSCTLWTREKKFQVVNGSSELKNFIRQCVDAWRHLDAEAIVWRCSMHLFGRQERVDITVIKAGKELQMPRFLWGSANQFTLKRVKVAHKGMTALFTAVLQRWRPLRKGRTNKPQKSGSHWIWF